MNELTTDFITKFGSILNLIKTTLLWTAKLCKHSKLILVHFSIYFVQNL